MWNVWYIYICEVEVCPIHVECMVDEHLWGVSMPCICRGSKYVLGYV